MESSGGKKRAKAVVLYSGGLDSTLAAEVLLRAGVEVVILRHHSIFFPFKGPKGYEPDCPTIVREISDDILKLVKNPQYGHGRNANPCMDCKQMMYGKAWAEAQRQGADFIATGEVLGQRPMSQRLAAFRKMEAGAGVVGRVVRPLCGKLLPATTPEQEGLINRSDLLDINGRSRKRQMELAARWGIEGYPTPAGGCKLTDPQYGSRVFQLARMGLLTVANAAAARSGRLFELGAGTLVLVGRNHEDNRALLADAPEGSLILELADNPGPLACRIGDPSPEHLEEAKRLVIRYSRFKDLSPGDVAEKDPAEVRRSGDYAGSH